MSIDRYLRVSQVTEYVGLSRASIYAMEKAGTFPKKIPLGARAVAWLESDIKKWMEERKGVVKTGREAKPGRILAAKKPKLPKNVSSFGLLANLDDRQRPSESRIDQTSQKSPKENDEELVLGNPLRSEKEKTALSLGEGHNQVQKPVAQVFKRSGPKTDLVKLILTTPSKPRLSKSR